jgi:hypothetical protein
VVAALLLNQHAGLSQRVEHLRIQQLGPTSCRSIVLVWQVVRLGCRFDLAPLGVA